MRWGRARAGAVVMAGGKRPGWQWEPRTPPVGGGGSPLRRAPGQGGRRPLHLAQRRGGGGRATGAASGGAGTRRGGGGTPHRPPTQGKILLTNYRALVSHRMAHAAGGGGHSLRWPLGGMETCTVGYPEIILLLLRFVVVSGPSPHFAARWALRAKGCQRGMVHGVNCLRSCASKKKSNGHTSSTEAAKGVHKGTRADRMESGRGNGVTPLFAGFCKHRIVCLSKRTIHFLWLAARGATFLGPRSTSVSGCCAASEIALGDGWVGGGALVLGRCSCQGHTGCTAGGGGGRHGGGAGRSWSWWAPAPPRPSRGGLCLWAHYLLGWGSRKYFDISDFLLFISSQAKDRWGATVHVSGINSKRTSGATARPARLGLGIPPCT